MRTHLATVPARNPFHFPIPIYYTTRTVTVKSRAMLRGARDEDACALFREAVAAAEHPSSACRELAVQLFWRVAHLCHQSSAGASVARELEAEAVSHVCTLLTDVSPAVRIRASLLLATLPHVPADRLVKIICKEKPWEAGKGGSKGGNKGGSKGGSKAVGKGSSKGGGRGGGTGGGKGGGKERSSAGDSPAKRLQGHDVDLLEAGAAAHEPLPLSLTDEAALHIFGAAAKGAEFERQQRSREELTDGSLLLALEDEDVTVRRHAVTALAELSSRPGGRLENGPRPCFST